MIDVSIIIVSFNTKKLLLACLESIKRHTEGISFEVVVIDNASDDGSTKGLGKDVRVIANRKNLGFSRANNQGIKEAKGRYILLLNSDTEFKENTLKKMVDWMDQHPKVGISTCTLLNPDGSIQATGGRFPDLLRMFLWAKFLDDLPGVADLFGSYHPHTPNLFGKSDFYKREHRQDWVTGAFLLTRKEVLNKIGGLDEKFFMYVEEVDLCMRAKKDGWETWYIPATKVVHIGAASGKGEKVGFGDRQIGKEGGILGEFEGLKRFYKKHYPSWQYPILTLLLKTASVLRIVVFGILGGQKEALRIYAKAFRTI